MTAPPVEAWAETVLRVLRTPFPYGAAHASTGPDDVDVTPSRLHPAFHGSLDWHSSAHMQWSAVRLLPRVDGDLADRLRAELDARLTPAHLEAEAAYLRAHPGYERPYGWGWLLALADATGGTAWGSSLRPVADVVVDHLQAWLPRLAYPVRHGVHANTAFALGLAWDAEPSLRPVITERATTWFAGDHDAPVDYEPSGADFLSGSLCEADLMRRVLTPEAFTTWLEAFLPRLGDHDDPLLAVPVVLDRTDGHAVHLYGLALSRAAGLRRLAPFLPEQRAHRAYDAADAQVAAVADEIVTGDFMATHWLVSFALLAQDALDDQRGSSSTTR